MKTDRASTAESDSGHFTYLETVLWIASRDRDFVQRSGMADVFDIFDGHPEPSLDRINARLDAACARRGFSAELARLELRSALREGCVTASGLRSNLELRREIPWIEWKGLTIGNLPVEGELSVGINAVRTNWLPGQPAGEHYIRVLFHRANIFKAFPELGTSSPIEGNPWADYFTKKPSKSAFVTHPEMRKRARERLAAAGIVVSDKSIASELAEMWNEVPAWGRGGKQESFASLWRRHHFDSKLKKRTRGNFA